MTTQLVFVQNGQALTTSEIIAQGVGIEHRAILQTLRNYKADFETFGILTFETQKPSDAFEMRSTRQDRRN